MNNQNIGALPELFDSCFAKTKYKQKKRTFQTSSFFEIYTNLKCSLCLLNQCAECSIVVDCQFGQHLAVDFDASLLQTVHETAVIDVTSLASCRDTGNPQTAEVALLVLTADVSILEGLHNRLIGSSKVGGLSAKVALCTLQNLLSSLARHHRALNSCHVRLASCYNL